MFKECNSVDLLINDNLRLENQRLKIKFNYNCNWPVITYSYDNEEFHIIQSIEITAYVVRRNAKLTSS